MTTTKVNRYCWIMGHGFFLFHFLVLTSYAVDIPFWDEWILVPPYAELGDGFSGLINWLLMQHNEHRIVLTKLIVFLFANYSIYSFSGIIILNYLFFWIASALFVRQIEKTERDNYGVVFLLLNGFSSWESHHCGFTNQIHFVIFFGIFAFLTAFQKNWRIRMLSPVFVLLATFSFSAGVVLDLALSLACFSAVFLLPERKDKIYFGCLGAFSVICVAAWFMPGFSRDPQLPVIYWPWTLSFWTHFLTILSTYIIIHENSLRIILGIFTLLMICFSIGLLVRRFFRVRENNLPALGFLGAIVGFMLAIASISMARAGFGADQGTSSRYSEFCCLLLCISLLPLLSRFQLKPKIVVSLLVLFSCISILNASNAIQKYREQYISRSEGITCLLLNASKRLTSHIECPQILPVPIEMKSTLISKMKYSFVEQFRSIENNADINHRMASNMVDYEQDSVDSQTSRLFSFNIEGITTDDTLKVSKARGWSFSSAGDQDTLHVVVLSAENRQILAVADVVEDRPDVAAANKLQKASKLGWSASWNPDSAGKTGKVEIWILSDTLQKRFRMM